MRRVLGAGALGRPRGMGWGGRQEGGSGWGTHVSPWLIHVNVWQKPLQYCKVISLQLIKINGKKKQQQKKKIRDTERTFHAKMDTLKERKSMDQTEAEEIKKSWQEYTEELYKKDFNYLDNHTGVITYLESDILDCEVKWALGSISMNKGSRGDGIPAELFQILKDDAVEVLHSIC